MARWFSVLRLNQWTPVHLHIFALSNGEVCKNYELLDRSKTTFTKLFRNSWCACKVPPISSNISHRAFLYAVGKSLRWHQIFPSTKKLYTRVRGTSLWPRVVMFRISVKPSSFHIRVSFDTESGKMLCWTHLESYTGPEAGSRVVEQKSYLSSSFSNPRKGHYIDRTPPHSGKDPHSPIVGPIFINGFCSMLMAMWL